MGTTSEKLTYLNETKRQIKETINFAGGTLTNETFRQYPEKLYDKYLDILKDDGAELFASLPKATGSGTSISLNNTANTRMDIGLAPTLLNTEDFTQVEYLQSTGVGEYIDTGFKPNSNTTFELDFQFVSSNYEYDPMPIFGERDTDSGSNRKVAIWVNKNSKQVALNFGTYDSGFISNTDTSARHIVSNNNATLYYDGTAIAYGSTQTFSTSPYTMYMFALHEEYLSYRNQITRIYSLKLYDNGTLVRYFIPCLRNSDNKPGMYDMVNSKFYTNQGNGEFVYGELATIENPKYPQVIHGIREANEIVISNSDNTQSQTLPLHLDGMDLTYCKIGNYSDEFYLATESDTTLQKGKWYLKQNISKLRLTGSEYTWSYNSTYQYFQLSNTSLIKGKSDIGTAICTGFPDCRIGNTSRVLWLFDYNNYFGGNTTTFKTWLSTHNLVVYYIRNTPIYTLLNDTLQEELNNIKKALSYDTQTNISQVNNDLPFVISASAIRQYFLNDEPE